MKIQGMDEAGKYSKVTDRLNRVLNEVGKVIVGQEEVLEKLLIAILCDGNVLVESYPGLGKTKMIRTISDVMGLEFSRIQNTPDLMPSDITGTHIIDESAGEKEFIFQRGPIFANMILADEINRATPKCVTGDTSIVTSEGEVREAQEIFRQEASELVKTEPGEEWWKPSRNLEVPSFNPETGEMETKPVSYIYRQKTEKPTYRVKLGSGREIEVSGTHPFFTVEDGKIETRKAKDIGEDDCVLLPGSIDAQTTAEIEYDEQSIQESEAIKEEVDRRKKLHQEFKTGMNPSDANQDRHIIAAFSQKTPAYIDEEFGETTFVAEAEQFGQIFPLEMPEKVTEKLAHFTALTVAEGYTSMDKGIQIDMKSHELVEYTAELIEAIFDYEVKIYDSDGDKKRIVASSSTFSKLLDAMDFNIDANSAGKKIPDFIMKAPKKEASEFLKMFFEAEGTVKKEHVKFTSKSEYMINQLSYLLLRFGITSRINPIHRNVNGGKEDYWELRLYGENVQKFEKEIGFYGERKSKQLEKLANRCEEGKFMDLIPDMHPAIKEIRERNELTHEQFHKLTGLYSHNLENPNNRKRHSKRKLKTICEGLEQYDTGNLEKVARGDFTTDFVKEVEKREGEKTLYDLTVEDNHSFIAGKGGIIVHNTQSALLEAMQEKQVTAGNKSYQLDKPFFLMATQNPIDQEGSLHPSETLYMDGKLWEARDTLEYARENGEVVHEGEDMRMYDADTTTQTLTPEGEMEQSDCMVYEKEYDGHIYSFETKTGRRIRVSGNHPFLVNRSGTAKWVKAEELEEGDYLVTPEKLGCSEEELPSHRETIEQLSEDYTVLKAEEVEELVEKLESGDELGRDDLDGLRIASGLSKKQLAGKIDASYDQVLNYLEGAENEAGEQIAEVLGNPEIEPTDSVESFNIHRFEGSMTDEEAGFLTGFIAAEGTIDGSSVRISQKNLPGKFDRWVEIAGKTGMEVEIRKRDSCREARVSSKPLVDYLKYRYPIDNIEEVLHAPPEFRKSFLEIFLLTESHFDPEKRRITFTQKDRHTTNVISHLLLQEGITSWIYDEGRVHRLRIQGEDLGTYLEKFEWRGKEPETAGFDSAHRVTPLDAEKIKEIVDLLGIKYGKEMSSREWYNSYSYLQNRRDRMANGYLEKFIEDMEAEIADRKRTDAEELVEKNIQEAAHLCGLSMTEIKQETSATKHQVWQSYQNSEIVTEVEEHVKERFDERTERAEKLLEEIKNLVERDVFYDRIDSIKKQEYSGDVIGLAVPGTHNYVAGLGACGINHNTYPLPEAQSDRFLIKVKVDYPPEEDENQIVERFTQELNYEPELETVLSKGSVIKLQEFTTQVPIADDIRRRAVKIVKRTRTHDDLEWGASPRASLSLVRTSKARALLEGRNHVSEEDIEEMAMPVLRHRIGLNFQAEKKGRTPEDVIEEIVDET